MYDTGQIQNLVSTGVLNIMKDSFSVIAFGKSNVLPKLEVSFIRNFNDAVSWRTCKIFRKRIGKAVGKAGEASGVLITFFAEIFRGSG